MTNDDGPPLDTKEEEDVFAMTALPAEKSSEPNEEEEEDFFEEIGYNKLAVQFSSVFIATI